jgi:hypothetical protein
LLQELVGLARVRTTRLATVVVGVRDLGVRVHRLRDLVDMAADRQAGADIEELADARLAGQVPDGPGQEVPVIPRCSRRAGQGRRERLRGFPVHRVVVLPAEVVVVNPASSSRRPRLIAVSGLVKVLCSADRARKLVERGRSEPSGVVDEPLGAWLPSYLGYELVEVCRDVLLPVESACVDKSDGLAGRLKVLGGRCRNQ